MLNLIQDNIWYVLIVINYLLAISAVTTLLFRNINPTKTLSYIIVLVFFPFLGLVVYYLFGQEYRKSKIFNRKNILNQKIVKQLNESLEQSKAELDALEHDFLDDKIKLVKLLQKSDKAPLTKCNTVEILLNGENKFERLLEDLKAAENHIHIEYYIIRDDIIGTKVLNILCDKAKSGVKVRLSIDDVGSSITRKMKSKLTASGVEFYSFMPVLFPEFTGRMNYRNHRKIVIIDGVIGYIGGINISDAYVNYPDSDLYWRDTHLRLEGEAIVTLQVQFLINWNFVSNSELEISQSFFPNKPCKNDVAVQIAASGPDTDWSNIMEVLFSAITTSEDYIYLTTPYFIPNPQIITALQVAARSGIDVRVLIPDKSDSWTAKYATNAYLDSLLTADVKVYRYEKGFIHAKTLVVDNMFSTIGTSNMDYRSFNINFEINAVIYNEKVSKELKSIFLNDLESAKLMDPIVWSNRSKTEKIKESICKLWAPLL